MKTVFYCESLTRDHKTNTPAMDIVRRVASSLSAGMVVDFLDDASLVRLLRGYTDWKTGAEYSALRRRIRLIERIEGVNLDDLATPQEMLLVFKEISDVEKYPPG